MASVTSQLAPVSARKARVGISLFFLTNGALYANMLPRLPEIKADLHLTNAQFGLAIAAFALGSTATAHLPALLMRRLGPLRQALLFTLLLAVAMALVGVAGSVWPFVALLFIGGFSDGIIDPAQNVHGLRVQRAVGRSIINSLHALWSAGAALGGVLGTLAARAGLPVAVHLPVAAVVFAGLAVLATWLSRLPVEGPSTAGSPHEDRISAPPRTVLLALAALVALAISGVVVEDVGSNWAALFLVQITGMGLGAAGVGYVTLMVAQLAGRLLGDPLTDRYGRVTMARAGGVLVLAGFALTVLLPAAPAALTGFALAGFGCATIVPAAFAAADEVPGLAHGTGVTIVGWLMRLGLLGTSPLIGTVSQEVGLRGAFVVPVAAGLMTVLLAGAVRRGSDHVGD